MQSSSVSFKAVFILHKTNLFVCLFNYFRSSLLTANAMPPYHHIHCSGLVYSTHHPNKLNADKLFTQSSFDVLACQHGIFVRELPV